MRRIVFILLLLVISITGFDKFRQDAMDYWYHQNNAIDTEDPARLTPMESLDMVKEVYATNFIKVNLRNNYDYYYYKLDIADYYLVFEDADDTTGDYLFHLYEFVVDDLDTGIGHTVTYGWYWVDPYTHDIWGYPESSTSIYRIS